MFMFLSMHVPNFMFWVCMLWNWNDYMVRDYYFTISRKGVPWKSWLDPRFPRNTKSKWTLKWLPLDRGYLKFYFHKGESLPIISCHTYLSTRNFVIFISSHIYIAMHFILVKISRNLVLLINNPSKRGDVETLAPSSVSSSSRVKMRFNLAASR